MKIIQAIMIQTVLASLITIMVAFLIENANNRTSEHAKRHDEEYTSNHDEKYASKLGYNHGSIHLTWLLPPPPWVLTPTNTHRAVGR